MLTGDIRSQIDRIWNEFWTGGISNPLEVIEQITYLLFVRRLDEQHTLEERKAATLKRPMERRIFPEGKDERGRAYEDLRWSRFKHFEAGDMFRVVADHLFPFLRTLGGDGSTYAHHMKDARFTIPRPALLAKVVDLLDAVPMADRDTKGDLYEYMLGKIASAGQNGQFRTPRHIIQLIVELTAPGPKDVICDPACGTAGFLVAAGEYLRDHHPEIFRDAKLKQHFHEGLCCHATMKNAGKMLRREEIEFFLRLHSLWEGVVSLPPPPDPPYDIESIEPTDVPPVWVWAGETELPPPIWWECGSPVKPKPTHPELDLGEGRVLVLDRAPGPIDNWPVFSNN